MLRYLELPADIIFGLFLISWLITRHILFILIIVSTFTDVHKVLDYAWIPEEGVWFTRPVFIAFVSMLIALQVRYIFFCFPVTERLTSLLALTSTMVRRDLQSHL